MHRSSLKHFKDTKRKEFFPEIVVGTVDIILQTSHCLIIIIFCWLRHYATDRKVTVSIPDEVSGFLN
jgi:hypothetical protein